MPETHPEQIRTLHEAARLERLEPIRVFVSDACRAFGLGDHSTFQLVLAVDEACTNIIEHGFAHGVFGAEQNDTIGLELRCDAARIVVSITDHGRAFDPDTIAPADLSSDWRSRRVGGLGWYLITEMTDAVYYTPQPGSNRLTLVKRLEPSP